LVEQYVSAIWLAMSPVAQITSTLTINSYAWLFISFFLTIVKVFILRPCHSFVLAELTESFHVPLLWLCCCLFVNCIQIINPGGQRSWESCQLMGRFCQLKLPCGSFAQASPCQL
jgi:hypothetical protein